MEGRSRIEPFLRAMATLARAVGSDLEDCLVSLGLPPDSELRTPVSRQEQLEAARAILAITARFLVVNANGVGEVTAEELLETPVDELSPEQSEKIIRAAKRETAEALWRTELAPRDPKITALAIAFVESYGGPPLAHQAHLTSTQLPRARQAATAN